MAARKTIAEAFHVEILQFLNVQNEQVGWYGEGSGGPVWRKPDKRDDCKNNKRIQSIFITPSPIHGTRNRLNVKRIGQRGRIWNFDKAPGHPLAVPVFSLNAIKPERFPVYPADRRVAGPVGASPKTPPIRPFPMISWQTAEDDESFSGENRTIVIGFRFPIMPYN